MDKLKVAFFGTSDRSIPILQALDQNFDLALCVTKSDVNIGRHQEKRETSVKTWSKEHAKKFITISLLKGLELEDVIEQLKSSNIDYIVVADFSFIIPERLIELYPDKIINIHFSLLPQYRGASPVQFTLLNGDDTAGITYHLVVRKMDAGAILHQIGYKITNQETSGYLYDTLFDLAARELPDVINQYHSGVIKVRQQDETQSSYTFSHSHPQSTFIYKEDAEIDWAEDPQIIERKVRAYNPWPIAWTTLSKLENNKKLNNAKVKFKESINKEGRVKLFSAKITDEGLLDILEIQPEGKRKMKWEEFKNGYTA